MKNKFYITTPIYYVNAQPHLGHTYTTVAADVLARFHRMIGQETFFLTGTDEHGAKIAEKAAEAGVEPQKFVDEVANSFQIAWKELNISNDRFIRTTEADHKKAVQRAMEVMYAKGDIYKAKYEGLYCQGCEQFKNEKDLVDGKCPDHKTVPQWMSEEAYMFKLSKYQDELLKKIQDDELMILPVEKKNEVLSFFNQQGLKDIAFSREKVKWGIPVPWDKDHTIYVWADAFLNYLTGLGWKGEEGELPKFWPADVQLIGKDILRVHATIWPAMLLSLGLPVQKQLFTHGFFLSEGQKMSKSLGNVIAPEDLVNKYGVDGTRYLLMSATTFGNDGDITWKYLDEKYNADLANGLGNLVARVSNLLEKNNIQLELKINSDSELYNAFLEKMNAISIDEALKTIWKKITESDEWLSEHKPWKMEGKEEIKKVLAPVAQNILNIGYLLEPFMPMVAGKIIKQFSQSQISKGESLFPRI
ncbi:MAG: Methionine-tRNA ligase [Parcubacteria group bacterium GW2011_GWE2_38_18]|nr:MAG: Methionine-tRNA ligase [Parcubacteria group bacterium GW2011_GWE2_38_18]